MAVDTIGTEPLRFVWLEITRRCQLACLHCYSESGPSGNHGSMTVADWRRVIDQAADLGATDIQFIGGEPTLHSALRELIGHARDRGLDVEVYTNLARPIPDSLWWVFSLSGVSLATSYYSADAAAHEAVTLGRGSHRRTRENIIEALRRSIPIRVGIVEIEEDQGADEARAELIALGVRNVNVDRMRQVGRGVREQRPSIDQLCGRCADGSLAVSPSGEVWPCVFSRWLTIGSVRDRPLAAINHDAGVARAALRAAFTGRDDKCDPKCSPKCDPCDPNKKDGDPGMCGPDLEDCGPFPKK